MVDGLRLVLFGLIGGLIALWAFGRVIRHFLYGISATDPLITVATLLVIAAVATLASAIPARRAARVSPLRALSGG
jgi:ABC-type antimicrobial peptide transport system permease subunit